MSNLQMSLLGQVAIQKDGNPLKGFKSSKAVAILCYLAVMGGPCARSTLVGLLWSELPEANARMNLRKVLENLRQLVGAHLVITRQAVAFNQNSTYWLDVEQFVVRLSHTADEETTEQRKEVAKLYRGEFLEGLEVRQAPAFEEWMTQQRTHLRECAIQVLTSLADHFLAQGDLVQCIAYLRRLLALEPWHEAGHRQLMRLFARSGQFNAALAQYETCRQLLIEELGVEPSAETTELYRQIRTGVQARRHNLPVQTTPFVGRTRELLVIKHHLADPACRLLTLAGPGGFGKTRLALQAAAIHTDHFLHGVVFVSFASVPSPAFFASAVADALQLPHHQREETAKQVLDFLHNREMLLVLDNLEHLLPEMKFLANLLAAAPNIKILATSRQRLNLKAEWLFDINGLDLPTEDTDQPADQYSAVCLFHAIARRAQVSFSFDSTNLPAVVRVCRLVEGMPLAIELAASWIPVLDCAEIASGIASGLDLLMTTELDVPARHQSLQAVFEQSWHLLSPTQQATFMHLSVFHGGFRQEAARAVCGVTIHDLAGLIGKSFLRRTDAGRYTSHELIRQFAANKLAAHVGGNASVAQGDAVTGDAEQAVRWRHSHYYLQWVADQESTLYGATPQLAIEQIQDDIDNVRQAWQWTVESAHSATEWEPLAHALETWIKFCHLRGHYAQAKVWLEQALDCLGQRLATDPQHAHWRLKSRLLVHCTETVFMLADYRQALQYAEEADTLAAQVDDTNLQARAQTTIGMIYRIQRQYHSALAHQKRAYLLLGTSGDQRQVARLLLEMGASYEQLHRWEDALKLQQEALQLFQQQEDSGGVAACWGAMGSVHYGAGDLEQSLRCSQMALDIVRRLNSQPEVMQYTAEIGKVHWRRQQYPAALDCLHQALSLANNLGLAHGLSTYYRIVGHVYRETGEWDKARSYLGEALRLAQATGVMAEQMNVLGALSFLNEAEGDLAGALYHSESALQLAKELGEERHLARSEGWLGLAYFKLGQYETARELLEDAVTRLKGLGVDSNVPTLVVNLKVLADVLYHQGDHVKSAARCQEGLGIIAEHAATMFESNQLKLATASILAQCHNH